MATVDDLSNELSALTTTVNSLQSTVSEHTTEIHNLDTRLDTAESKLTDHSARILTLEEIAEDHENRLQLIENSSIKYTVSRSVKYPKKADQGFYLYMPSDLTVDILMQYNAQIRYQKWNWFNKVFNRQGFGRVSFDLKKDEEGHINAIVLGQNTRLLIPTGIAIEEFTPTKSILKVANEETNSILHGLVYGIEVVGQDSGEEIIISVFNPTSSIITLYAGDVLVQVLHLFSYHTIPEKQ